MALGDILSSLAVNVAKSAPLLATALGSPMAGIALSMLGEAFGISPTRPQDILDHLKNDPDSLAKLKEIELQHEQQLSQIALQAYQSQLTDVQNARAAKLASEQFTGKKDWLVTFLVIMAVLLFGFCLFAAYSSNGAANQMFLFLIGQQSGVYLSVYAFYFSGIDPKKMFDNVARDHFDS
jgi:hypothetical protein